MTAGGCAPPAVALEATDEAEGVREKGEGMAENRREGFDAEAALISATDGAEIGEIAEGWVEVGLPPGVRARCRVIPILPAERASTDWECGRVGVDDPGLEGISPGVVVRIGNRSGRGRCADVDVSEGSKVEDSVLRPVGVSNAVT